MSNSQARSSQPQKITKPILEPCSAQDLCEQLHKLVQVIEWNNDTAEKFINLVINPNKQFQLNSQQRDSLVQTILNCPVKYRATVHLAVISANFTSRKGLRSLDGIIPAIGSFISEQLELTPGMQENLLKNQGDKLVYQFIKEKLAPKNIKQKTVKIKENHVNKLDIIRNLFSLLLCQGEIDAIATRLNLILEILAGSNHYQQLVKVQLDSNEDIKYRVKAITELIQLVKPTATEAERLLLFGTSSQLTVTRQAEEIKELNENLQNERNIRRHKDERIQQLEQQCQELKQQLLDAEENVKQMQVEIEREKELYVQLFSSSQAEISQQREAVLSRLRNRLEHELIKLQRCLDGDIDSFLENSEIGLSIIKTINEKLAEQD